MRIQQFMLAGLCLFLFTISSCSNKPEEQADAAFLNLIPKPVEAKRAAGYFNPGEKILLVITPADSVLQSNSALLTQLFPSSTLVPATERTEGSKAIVLQLVSDSTLGKEGYALHISDSLLNLQATTAAGIFYGLQTIRQLLPADNKASSKVLLANGSIRDYPRFAIRGSMLDVARHFFSVADVKRYIDLLAYYKLNTLHLHLSDDQGWRIEIKKWPRLTEYGGSTQVGGGAGGFYTQEQFKELVQYAAERYISIIPEIDMPGHTHAAVAAYPELNCNPKDTIKGLYTGTEVGFSTLCTTNEQVYGFINDVVSEIAAISPSPYFHMGGDESLVTPEEEYIAFVNRVQGIIHANGKQVIGWDEIAHASLQPGTVAQHWSDTANPVKAVAQGAKLIMSPATRVYMDMQYDSTTRLGLHWAAYIEADQAYNWDPAKLVKGIGEEQILGIVAPLWTETIVTMKDIEYMVFPRLTGYAEIGWSPQQGRSWDEYKNRLVQHAAFYTAWGIDYYRSPRVPWQ